ncbi:kynureninase-like [Manduca sexta]|uniref:kynureninase-like n=1 Tax=Manduca sexta TaxID=7130 RepID=UPI0018907441|nr:kynureninase-like [Manduca sexta]
MDRNYQEGPDYPKFLDNNDPLGHFRQRFYVKKDVIYMCGNSLGLASKEADECTQKAMDLWKEEGIKIWNYDNSKYFLYSDYLARMMAPIVGADANEIAVVSSTTVNIHQVISTFYKPTETRYKILVDDINFPTDRYVVDSQVMLKGYDPKDAVKIVSPYNGKFMDEDEIINNMTPDVAVVFLPTVYYRTAQILDMDKITKVAKERGIVIGWDLCHAVGAIEINLTDLDADFAVWCTYKYLNGGPGSAAALYINKRHFQMLPGMFGWYGNKTETQFALNQEFEHQQDASGWQLGSPTVASMASLEGALKIFCEAGMGDIRKKSLHITGYLMFLIEAKLLKYGFSIGNFKEDSKRGGHVCLEHDEAYKISITLKKRGVVPDFRPPNVIRLAPVALYNTYQEVYDLVEILLNVVKTGSYKEVGDNRPLVV